jgi:FkbM family methyltransferase
MLLGREPEDEAVVRQWVHQTARLGDLRDAFIASDEFARRIDVVRPFDRSVTVIAELRDGLRLFVDLADEGVGRLVAEGLFELGERRFAKESTSLGSHVLDIGANIGVFTVELADRVGPHGTVQAFEPVGRSYALLARSIVENGFDGRVRLHRVAVAEGPGRVGMLVGARARNMGGSEIVASDIEDAGEGFVIEHVDAVALDAFDLPRPIEFIKVDIEGAEGRFLRGATSLLAEDRPVVLSELYDEQLQRVSGCTGEVYVSEMKRLGYECRLLENGRPGQTITRPTGRAANESVVFMPR